MRNASQAAKAFDQIGFEFLITDLNSGIHFTDKARQSFTDYETRLQNLENARVAYDLVLYRRKKVTLTSAQETAFEIKRLNLKAALTELGEAF